MGSRFQAHEACFRKAYPSRQIPAASSRTSDHQTGDPGLWVRDMSSQFLVPEVCLRKAYPLRQIPVAWDQNSYPPMRAAGAEVDHTRSLLEDPEVWNQGQAG